MLNSNSGGRTSGEKDFVLSNVALLYYGEGLTQGEIAKRLKVSRATVVNMLREGRERGIVDIRVDGKHLSGSNLSRKLQEKFDLADVYIAINGDAENLEQDREHILPQVARVAAAAVVDIVEPGDKIGVAWGETIMAVANAMSPSPTQSAEVCQLIGSMVSERVPASENCAIQIANKLSATCFTLHAPGIVSSEELADIFRAEPTIRSQLKRLENLDMTIAAIGNLASDTHLKISEMVTDEEMAEVRKRNAHGILCCRFIDQDGNGINMPPQNRIIAAKIENLKAARKKLLVVCGVDRAEATRAAIKGGLVTHLCVDQALGQILLEND